MSVLKRDGQMVAAKHAAANMALFGLTDRQRTHYALAIISGINDPDAVAALRFAANQISEVCNRLTRKAASQREGL